MTLPEKHLWAALRAVNLHIRRQAPVGRYVADFVIHGSKLVIEVDGLRHTLDEAQLYDFERDAWFASQGYLTLRFSNQRVLEDIEGVLADIQAAVEQRQTAVGPPPSPTLPPSRGKGDPR